MNKKLTLTTLAVTGVLGFAAAGLAPVAMAWSPSNLPAGFVVNTHTVDNSNTSCPESYSITAPDGTNSGRLCDQAAVDAFVNAHYTPPATTTTTTAQTTTTTPTTTTTAAAPVNGGTSSGTSTVTVTDPRVDTLQTQVTNLQAAVAAIQTQLTKLIQILEQWPGIDPAILSQLQTL